MVATLDRFRAALKFSLWAWAAYWPGGGLLLLYGGLDPISIIVTLGSLACFIVLLATGALKADSSRSMKEFLIERPLYLIAGLVVAIVLAAIVPSIEGFALLVFATLWFGSLSLATARMVEHLRETKQGIWEGRADQIFLVFGLAGFFSSLVFLDALLPLFSGGETTTGSPATLVAISTWMNLLYPVLVLIAARPFRDPLNFRLRRSRDPMVNRDPMAAKRRKESKEPRPFRAS